VRLRVLPEPSTSQARALSRRNTSVMQKVKEAELTWFKSKGKGKGKAKVNDTTMEEVRMERLKKLKAERAIIQEMIDQLES
jgi:rhamnose utilization protein RhaD (predicted bifunctional aldolase and dehydrogenase)